MPRFFIEAIISDDTDRIEIGGDDARHIRDVLRMQAGESVTVCDNAHVDLNCTINAFYGGHVELLIINRKKNETEPSFFATLYQGLPKGDKFDQIIQKSVELGVSRIVPVICQRSIVKIRSIDAPNKTARWCRIAQEAAKQCGRGQIPEITQSICFADAVMQVLQIRKIDPFGTIAFVPYEGERQETLRDFLELKMPRGKPVTSISFFIGPEGGLASEEIELAVAADIHTVSLGRRILRTETAGPAVLAMLGYHVSDF